VDAGTLLLLASRGDMPILGLPGCARSPKRSGFDEVLERVLAGLPADFETLAGMGVGGLLSEIPERPQPRGSRGPDEDVFPRVAGLVLAAGSSSRMPEGNKLLEEVEGVPMVARAVDVLVEAGVDEVMVVTGHQAEAVEDALGDRPVRTVHNPRHVEGMSTSLRAGVASLPPGVDGVLVMLGDMPRVQPEHVRAVVGGFGPDEGRAICIPVHAGKRGHPVLLASRFFPDILGIRGDVGARGVVADHPDLVYEVPVDDPGVLLDVDTREVLERVREGG